MYPCINHFSSMGLAILLKPDKNWLMQESEGPCALCDCVWRQAGYRGIEDDSTIGSMAPTQCKGAAQPDRFWSFLSCFIQCCGDREMG